VRAYISCFAQLKKQGWLAMLLFSLFFLSFSTLSLNALEPFTGEVQNDKVRLRLSPVLESLVLEEVEKGTLLAIKGEEEGFYSLEPTENLKAYVYANFIENGKCLASNVNVRLSPSVDAPVLAQLQQGDQVIEVDAKPQSGWIQIKPPKSVNLYVAKEYIKNIGSIGYIISQKRRDLEVKNLIKKTKENKAVEFSKPFMHISLQNILTPLEKVLNDYKDFPHLVNDAVMLVHQYKQDYLQLKVQFLENEKNTLVTTVVEPRKSLIPQNSTPLIEKVAIKVDAKDEFVEIEENIYNNWRSKHKNEGYELYKKTQLQSADELQGILEPYNRLLKNKPGNYVLVNPLNKLPIAYIYSTTVSLKEYEGQIVTILATERPNHNFAFPAYHVWSIH
jgi:hypothetical protein